MFQNLQVISPNTDAQTRYTTGHDWKVSADQISVPVTRDEMPALAGQFVLVFAVDTPSYPVALLGTDGKNTYLNKEGDWDGVSIPARMAIYPFSSVVVEGQVELARAADAANFKDPAGEALFDERGAATPFLQAMTMTVARSHFGVMQAMRLTGELDQAGLLKAAPLSFALADGTSRQVDGYRIVDEAALSRLDGATRMQLEHSGAMALVTAHRTSLTNVARLAAAPQFVAAKAPRKRAAPAKPAAPRAPAKRTAVAKDIAIVTVEKSARSTKPKAKLATLDGVIVTPVKRTRKPAATKEKLKAA